MKLLSSDSKEGVVDEILQLVVSAFLPSPEVLGQVVDRLREHFVLKDHILPPESSRAQVCGTALRGPGTKVG